MSLKGLRKEVPCGQCRACRKLHATDWTTRIVHERSLWEKAVFATLTYADEALPEYNSLDSEEVRRFWKRLRKRIAPRRIKYYGCGEYGERNGRPHYHAIIFGVGPEEREDLEACWPQGFVHCGVVSQASARYVCNYVGKSFSGELADEVYGVRARPFQMVSQGLGLGYLWRNGAMLRRDMSCTVDGKKVGLPRYYMQKLGLERRLQLGDEDIWLRGVERKEVLAQWHQEKVPYSEVRASIQRSREQREENLKAQMARKERNL